ncbi:MAG: TrmH family RNA methyltransferase [Acidimicrobiia bacterium]|nr:TrmH family RNA methyltransferase [Acidimicrobiia bacterium]
MSNQPPAPRPLGATELKRLQRQWRRLPAGRLHVLLDAVGNPFNVGSIIRTAAALRVEHLWRCGQVPSPGDSKVAKTALGTHRYLPSSHVPLDEALSTVASEGLRLVGVELADGAHPLFAADLGGDVCLAVGHEDRGLSATCLRACDEVVYIPHTGKVASLNVAQAAAMALYEVRRQHWSAATE